MNDDELMDAALKRMTTDIYVKCIDGWKKDKSIITELEKENAKLKNALDLAREAIEHCYCTEEEECAFCIVNNEIASILNSDVEGSWLK